MSTSPFPPPKPEAASAPMTVEELLAEPDDAISDEEADAEIDLGGLVPVTVQTAPVVTAKAPPVLAPPPKPSTGSDESTTPSVLRAVNKAADILRELRGES